MPKKSRSGYVRNRRKAYKKTSVNLKLKKNFRTKKKNLKKYAIAVFLFVISVGFLAGLSVYNYLTQNMASALTPSGSSEVSIVDDLYPTVTYVVIENFEGDPVVVESINYLIVDKGSKRLISYTVPLNVSVDVPGRFGEEEFSKIFALGCMVSDDCIDGGIDLLNRALFKVFGYRTDKYLLVTHEYKNDFDDYWGGGELLPLLTSGILNDMDLSLRTNLDPQEIFHVNKFLNSLPSDRFLSRVLTSEHISNFSLIDEEIRDITFESGLSVEKKNIAVLNGTGEAGIATFGARVIRNMGGRVVAVDNSLKPYEISSIVAIDDASVESVSEISMIFSVKDINSEEEGAGFKDDAFSRADIVLIIGFDFASRL